MQWVFLVLALAASLAEMHSGTFYLAGVAVAALLTALAGFWIGDGGLVVVFAALCVGITVLVALTRRRRMRGQDLADFDIGQTVLVHGVSEPDHRLTVTYRGTIWAAVMDDGATVVPGDAATILRKTDKLLHLTTSP